MNRRNMKKLNIALLVIIALLSLVAGTAKVAQVPEEMAFLEQFNLNQPAILVFGTVQILGGVLALISKTKLYGLWLVQIAFLVSAGLVFISGNIPFGVFSLLPVLLASFLIIKAWHGANNE